MQFLSALPISRKLPAIIVALCIAASLSIAVVGYQDFSRNIRSETEKSFELITQSRAEAISVWFERLGSDVAALGRDPTVVAAASGFSSSYRVMTDGPALQEAYITNNPNPKGARDLLDQPPEAIPYHFQHARFHPHFRQIMQTAGYYDFFIFNLEGDLMYTVAKEPDFATNFVSGPHADSGLGQAYLRARDGLSGQIYFADFAPYDPSDGAAASFLATPIVDEKGDTTGVVAIQLPATQIAAVVNNPLGLGETGELYVVGPDGRTRSAARFEGGYALLEDLSELEQVRMSLRADGADLMAGANLSGTPIFAMGVPLQVFDKQWGVVGEIAQAEVNAPVILVRNKMIAVTALVAAISIAIGWWTARAFVLPLGRLGEAMRKVSEKHYDITLDEQGRRDEIGTLANALLAFRNKLRDSDAAQEARKAEQEEQKRIVERLSLALGQLSRGDLTHKITTPFAGDYDQLRQDFNETVDKLNATLGALRERASEIRRRADDMSGAADDLSRRTESQAATLEQTAAALDEMTASVRSAASGAKEVAGVVTDARQDADESRPVVESAVQAMHAIAGSSDEISKIIGVIDDIAFQTNLLALNAGVEAARAGEAGRGFAVVASEVRALAQRSSDAAKQIKQLIGQSAHQVQDGVDLVGQAGGVLTKIAAHISHISDLIADIASGAEEQSIGLGEINIGVTQLDKVTQQNAAMVEEATANSHALKGDSGELADLVDRFKLGNAGGNELAAFAADAKSEDFSPVALQLGVEDRVKPLARPVVSGQAATAAKADFWEDF